MAPSWLPKSKQNQRKNNAKIDRKIDASWNRFLEGFWWILEAKWRHLGTRIEQKSMPTSKKEFLKKLLLSIDQGTTSSRSILFDLKGKKIFSSQIEFEQIFPNSGWVEHNPEEIWRVTLKTIKEAINKSKKLKSKIISIGITNQRETTILWDKDTGKPIYNAIVWQDRRTQKICENLKNRN